MEHENTQNQAEVEAMLQNNPENAGTQLFLPRLIALFVKTYRRNEANAEINSYRSWS